MTRDEHREIKDMRKRAVRSPSTACVFVLLVIRGMIAVLLIGLPILWLFGFFLFGPNLILIFPPFMFVAAYAQWITQNIIDDNEGLIWNLRICRIGTRNRRTPR